MKSRKFLRYLNILAIISLLAAAGFVNYHINDLNSEARKKLYNDGFKVTKIYINKLEFLDVEEIIDALDFQNGDPILDLDLVSNQQRLKANFWIEEVSIKMTLPNIIKINIIEKKPEFIYSDKHKFFVLDGRGKILKQIDEDGLKRFAGFVVVVGKNARLFVPNLLDFIKEDKEVYSYISLISWVSERRWNVVFVNDMLLKLPQQNPGKAWLKFLELNERLDFFGNHIKSIDLRVKDRLFIELDLDYPINQKIIEEVG